MALLLCSKPASTLWRASPKRRSGAFVLGSGARFAAAREEALKMLEKTRLAA